MSWKLIRAQLRLADFVLVALVICAIIVSARHFTEPQANNQVFVYKDNVLWNVYPLDRNDVIMIDMHNTLEIKDAKVRMIKADCPDKRCIKQGWTDKMPIICVPNRLIVEIKTQENEHKLILH